MKIKSIILAFGLTLAAASSAHAQCATSPNKGPPLSGGGSVFGSIVSQWIQYFVAKVDFSGGTACNINLTGTPKINGSPVIPLANVSAPLVIGGGILSLSYTSDFTLSGSSLALGSNVPKLNSANTFTAQNQFSLGVETTSPTGSMSDYRTPMSGTTTVYVNADGVTGGEVCDYLAGLATCAAGSDLTASHGTSRSSPYQTMQAALDYSYFNYDGKGNTLQFQLSHNPGGANGTNYAFNAQLGALMGNVTFFVLGDSTTPTAVEIVAPNGSSGVFAKDYTFPTLQSLAIADQGSAAALVNASFFGGIDLRSVTFLPDSASLIASATDGGKILWLGIDPQSNVASYTAHIAGTTLTVDSGPTSGAIAVGQFPAGVGITPGTWITAGSGSSWTVSASQTVASEAMTSMVTNTISGSAVGTGMAALDNGVELAAGPIYVPTGLTITNYFGWNLGGRFAGFTPTTFFGAGISSAVGLRCSWEGGLIDGAYDCNQVFPGGTHGQEYQATSALYLYDPFSTNPLTTNVVVHTVDQGGSFTPWVWVDPVTSGNGQFLTGAGNDTPMTWTTPSADFVLSGGGLSLAAVGPGVGSCTFCGISIDAKGRVTAMASDATAGQYPGVTTNTAASAGNLGEVQSVQIASGSAVSLSNVTDKSVFTLTSLPAGNWDLTCFMGFTGGTGALVTGIDIAIGTTNNGSASGTPSDAEQDFPVNLPAFSGQKFSLGAVGPFHISIASATTYYCDAYANFSGGTLVAYGKLRAIRTN